MKQKLKYIALALVLFIVGIVVLSFNILKNTPELNIHRMRGATDNQVCVFEGGHKEGVYDSLGNLVTDPVNMGSYNYSHPINEPVGHFIKDMMPWLIWGNSNDDPTSFSERFSAYRKDLLIGVERTFGFHN